ncbi:hypothetical protein BD626DRAFT_65418, partial [Schizophyllum amplum]
RARHPVEIIQGIVEEADTRDQLSLARCSRTFNRLPTMSLYRNVMLESMHNTVRYCKSVLSAPAKAKLLRVLGIIHSPTSSSNDHLISYLDLIARVLQTTTNLLSLSIVSLPAIMPLLAACPLPNLQDANVPAHNGLFAFLTSYPRDNLRSLTATAHDLASSAITLPGRVVLSHLRCFRGQASLAADILPGSQVEDVALLWPHDAHISDSLRMPPFSSLAASCVPVKWLTCVFARAEQGLLDACAASGAARNIQRLVITTRVKSEDSTPVLYNVISSTLDSFSVLAHLFLHSIVLDGIMPAQIEQQGQMIREWGQRQPTLKIVFLGEYLTWAWTPPDVWFPTHQGQRQDIEDAIVEWSECAYREGKISKSHYNFAQKDRRPKLSSD